MEKELKKRTGSNQKSEQFYTSKSSCSQCTCHFHCTGCGSVPANDYNNVHDNSILNNSNTEYYATYAGNHK